MSRLLLVDDNAQLVDFYKLVLEEAGHQVRTAGQFSDAVRLLDEVDPEIVIIDLCLPEMKDGLGLIRAVKDHARPDGMPPAKVVVVSGWTDDLVNEPENKRVDCVLTKPMRLELLLRSISELALTLLLCLAAAQSLAAETFHFSVKSRAEIVTHLEMISPGSNWAETGHEAALATIAVDQSAPQHVMLYAGDRAYTYSAFLGELRPGEHELRIEKNILFAARGSGLKVRAVHFQEVPPEDPYWPALAHAPILYARANTIGRFDDIPLLLYCERLVENGQAWLQYTMIFSNEDGGTSTRALMARWGRTTDVEYIYRAWLDQRGNVERATIQARDHKEVAFRGRREGPHPLLIPSTDNNMVSDQGSSPIRYQIPPLVMDLTAHSREEIMDEHPIAYRVMAQELTRENKLRPFGVVDGEKASDPRNYLYIEAKVSNRNSSVAALVRLHGDQRWFSSHLGRNDYAISRDEWVRTTVELPPGSTGPHIEEIGFECLVSDENKRTPLAGTCHVEQVSKVFMLDEEYRPQESIWGMPQAIDIPTGQIYTFAPQALH
jgi:CheY-like chemotaxis protein